MVNMRINKPVKIIVAVVAILIVAIITGNAIVKNVIEKKLTASLKQFQPYIHAGFSKAHINLFTASIQLDSLYVLYNPELKPNHMHKIKLPTALITDISFFKLVMHKKVNAGLFKLNDAEVQLDKYLLDKNDELPDTVFDNIKLPFKNILFNNVEIKNINITQKDGDRINTLCTASIVLNDLQLPVIDSMFSEDSIHFINVLCEVNDFSYPLKNYYTLKLKKFYLSSKDSVLQMDSLKFIPQVDKFQLGQKLGRQADHVNASVNTVKVEGLDVMKLQQNKLVARQINIDKSNIYVFRDRRLPRSKEKQPTPLDYLKRIPFEVNVDEFHLGNATATSEEFPKEGDYTGYIKLENLSVTMKPFINRATENNKAVISYVKASIMGAGNIQATIDLSLLTGNSKIKGAISKLQLTAMNPSAENLGRFHIQSGMLDFLSFDFTATDVKATGQVVGEYHDLVVDRLKLTKKGLKKAKLPSFLLHKIIIPKTKDASLDVSKRTGKIDYDRDPTRFITFYYLKALLGGIRDSFAFGFVLPS